MEHSPGFGSKPIKPENTYTLEGHYLDFKFMPYHVSERLCDQPELVENRRACLRNYFYYGSLLYSWKYYAQLLKAKMQNKMFEKGTSRSDVLHSCKSVYLWKELSFICVWENSVAHLQHFDQYILINCIIFNNYPITCTLIPIFQKILIAS